MSDVICPVCGNGLTVKHRLKFNVYKCSNCKLLHSDASFDYAFSPALNEERREQGLKKLRLKNFQIILQQLRKLKPGKTINGLEIGCGNGWWLQTCKTEKINCVGIEPEIIFNDFYEQYDLDVVNGFYPNDAVTRKDGFDFIIFNDVFEHIMDVESLIQALKKDLAHDGLLIINIPMSDGLFYRTSVFLKSFGVTSFLERMWQFNFPSPHINYFNSSNLLQLLSKYNFETVEQKRLLSMDASTVKERIMTDKSISRLKATVLAIGIWLLVPLIAISKPDIKVFFFRKKPTYF